jgi:hypothetical protein
MSNTLESAGRHEKSPDIIAKVVKQQKSGIPDSIANRAKKQIHLSNE